MFDIRKKSSLFPFHTICRLECKQPHQIEMSLSRRKRNTPGLNYLFSNFLFLQKCNLSASPAVLPSISLSFINPFSLPQFFRAEPYFHPYRLHSSTRFRYRNSSELSYIATGHLFGGQKILKKKLSRLLTSRDAYKY